jgi:hypothetical protein
VHGVGLEERLRVALRRAGVADDVEDDGGIGDVVSRPRPAEDLEDVLAVVRDERVDVDEGFTLSAPVAALLITNPP